MIKKILTAVAILFTTLIVLAIVAFFYITKQQKKLSEGELIFNQGKTTVIPFYYASSGHILIDVNVEGSEEKYPFILDSGAANFIFKRHSGEFDLESNGKGIGIGSTGNFFFSNIKKVDSIKIGELTFKNLNFKEMDFGFNCSENVYGLIGNGTMKHLNWQIDFENQKIIVSKKLEDLTIGNNKVEIPIRINKTSFHAYASIQFSKNKGSKRVIVDLGSSGTLSLKEKEYRKDSLSFKEKKIFGRSSEGLGGQNKNADTEKIVLADSIFFKKTDFSIGNFPVKVSPTALNLLGLGFFKKYKTTISWSDKKLILEPYDSIQSFIYKSRGFGMKYKTKEQKLIVKSVTENSPASKLNIPVNAEIIELNGKPVNGEKDLCDYYNLETSPDTLKIKIKHNNIVKEFGVTKEKLFDE
ncbi:PDZ domain-containing protein [Tenacibaculum sp. MEBiC06402]|uniref:PDZ domain-containing protein n=1 Tax=unclassified Tenacibaculum TaxID=2635139 RepID=UPI003B99BD04